MFVTTPYLRDLNPKRLLAMAMVLSELNKTGSVVGEMAVTSAMSGVNFMNLRMEGN